MPTLLVFGVANVGRVLAREAVARGWGVAGVARSQGTIDAFAAEVPEALGVVADAVEEAEVERAFAEARERFGGVDLVVGALTENPRFGPLTELGPDALHPYFDRLLPATWNVLRIGCRELERSGGGTFVQMTGGSARRGNPERAVWAATAFAVRAMTQSAAAELRERGVHVALLIVDAVIESPKTAGMLTGEPPERSASMEDVAAAVLYLAGQSPRAWSHELTLTPALERWVP